ncbi:hypothetical protein C2G38_2236483, partial [Gigaspora rosea]
MTPLPVEVFWEILKYLKHDHKTLFSCLLTSRKLCEITVPILWNEPNLESPKLVRTLISGLGRKEVKTFIPQNQQKPIFNYAQYIKTVSSGLTAGINKLIQSEENFKSMYFYDVLYELIKMILHSSKGLKILEIDGNERRLNYRFKALITYALNKKNALVSLQLLNLSIDDIEEQKELVYALSNNTTLVSLNLSNNQFGRLAGTTLAPILLKNKTLTSLNFSNNRRELTIKGVEAFASALSENKTLRSLTLSNDSLTREGGIILANALFKNETLKSLDL